MQLVRKITPKTVAGKKVTAKMINPDNPFFYRVQGFAEDMKITHHDTYGESKGLVGDFLAIDRDGNEFRGPVCYLPDMATAPILSQLSDASISQVRFAYDIGLIESENPVGYEYTVTPLVDHGGADPLRDMFAELPAPKTLVALPAPEPKKKGKK